MTRTMLQQEVDARNDILRDAYFILPLQSTAAAAGSGNAFNDLKPQPFFVKKNRFNAEADTLIRVSGHSMEPVYHDGDIVYVKYTTDVENNDIVICTTADGAVIKRMHKNKLYSLNPQYPYGEKSEDDHVQVIGKVIGTVSADEIPDAEDAAILKELNPTNCMSSIGSMTFRFDDIQSHENHRPDTFTNRTPTAPPSALDTTSFQSG